MMSQAYLSAIAEHGAALITYLGLVTDQGTEITASPYQRKAVSWVVGADGRLRPSRDLTFDVPAGSVVAGWHGYSAVTGGIDFGGESLIVERFGGQGQYTLLATGTGIAHRVA